MKKNISLTIVLLCAVGLSHASISDVGRYVTTPSGNSPTLHTENIVNDLLDGSVDNAELVEAVMTALDGAMSASDFWMLISAALYEAGKKGRSEVTKKLAYGIGDLVENFAGDDREKEYIQARTDILVFCIEGGFSESRLPSPVDIGGELGDDGPGKEEEEASGT